jgi:hypothetical protein
MTDSRHGRDDPPDTPQAAVPAQSAVPEQAAKLASEVSEARSAGQRRRLLAPFTAATRSASKSAASVAEATRSASKSAAEATREATRSVSKSVASVAEATRSAGKSAAGATRSAGKSAADAARKAGRSGGEPAAGSTGEAERSVGESAAGSTSEAGWSAAKPAADATRGAGRLVGKPAASVVEATRSATKSAAGATHEAALSAARATGRGVRATGRGVQSARRGMGGGTGWLAGQVLTMATRLRVRDEATLRAQFPGRSAEEIADALVEGAARASAAVGGAIGAWAALPVLPAFPAEIATETLALIGIEIKLVAELHEAYGVPAEGTTVERMTAYVGAWANRRGVALVPGGLVLVAGSPLARRLRWRLAARAGRTAFSLAPLLTGAAAGAMLNRRETRKLGQDIRTDLRGRVQDPNWQSSPSPSPVLPSKVLDQPES